MTAVTVGAGAGRRMTVGRPQARQGTQKVGRERPRPEVRELSANQPVETEFRLTRRGRRALAAAGVGVLLAFTGWGSSALADQPVAPIQTTTYTFLPGESLWQVAAAHTAPGQDVRVVLDQIMELNGMTTSAVQAGEMIRVPIND